ncbi:ABC transporter permease [Diaminobutyricimonas sp. TR449]|uniref:ABC transporter permease n=1 Tax=Diaminobutyricimonas sp. TR449 TaxID=2708076 RepID=UPI001420EA37|nr:ABC transporter permease [Diaminobutyricimonas sp. TR449]
MRLVGAEFAKLFSTRMWWLLLIVLVGYVAFISGLFALLFGALADQLGPQGGTPPEGIADLHQLVYSSATSIGYVFPVLLGALAVTAEFRHQTLTPTFLATPRRGRVLAAKIVALAVAGAGFGVAAFAAAIAVGAPLLGIGDVDPALDETETWLLVARGILAMALWGVIGVGLGALVPNQVAVIVIVLAFTQFVEPILRSAAAFWDWAALVGQYLPGSASDALVGSSFFAALSTGGQDVPTLEWWQGGLVLAGIAVVATLVGHVTTWKRDVT